MFKIAACSVVTTIQLIPYPLRPLHPTTPPLPWDQFAWCLLRWQTDFLSLLGGLSVGPVTLVLLLHTSTLPPSSFAAFILLPQAQMMMMSTTPTPGETSMAIRIF